MFDMFAGLNRYMRDLERRARQDQRDRIQAKHEAILDLKIKREKQALNKDKLKMKLMQRCRKCGKDGKPTEVTHLGAGFKCECGNKWFARIR
jgi:NADH pyrophosphatase NudC (nudix superfamily)